MDYSKKYQKYLHKLVGGSEEWRLAVNELSPENQAIVRPLIRDLHRMERLDLFDPEDLDNIPWFIEHARTELARPDTPVEDEDVAAAYQLGLNEAKGLFIKAFSSKYVNNMLLDRSSIVYFKRGTRAYF